MKMLRWMLVALLVVLSALVVALVDQELPRIVAYAIGLPIGVAGGLVMESEIARRRPRRHHRATQ